MTEGELRAKVCAQARAWLGRNEADGSHREIIDVYNAGRPPGSYKMMYVDPWCAAFVSAVGLACGLGAVLLPHVNCDGMINAYRAAECWIEDDDYLPRPGDLIFYDWQDDGAGDNVGSSDHVGIVLQVEDGREITVIEGNKSDAVSLRQIRRGARHIRGYAVPDYAAAADEADPVQAEDPAQEDQAELEGLPVLEYGCRGWTVASAQGALIAHGFGCGPDGADGDFGFNTRAAAIRFQRSMGLEPDGKIGPLTWAALLLGRQF